MRDPRWEKVWAHIGPVEPTAYDIETGYSEELKKWIEVRIEVPYNGIMWYQVQQIHKDDINDFKFDIWKFVLDKMVIMMDEAMNDVQEAR